MHRAYTDDEIIRLLREDGDKAIDHLFKAYYSDLCKAAYRILPDANYVEDIVQDVFYELWRRREKLQITTSLKAYLRRSTVNKTLNFIRDKKLNVFTEEETKADTEIAANVSQLIEAKELRLIIDKIVDSLPNRCRIVFILNRFEEMSYREIAEVLGISVKTVENQISKALAILRTRLKPYL